MIYKRLQTTDRQKCRAVNRKRGMNVSGKQELKNYVVNSIVHNAFDPNELLRLINLLPDQPQLNENQQIVLDWLKGRSKGGSSLFNAVQGFVGFNGVPILELNALMSLSNKEEAQVLQAFSQWALEQEEE